MAARRWESTRGQVCGSTSGTPASCSSTSTSRCPSCSSSSSRAVEGLRPQWREATETLGGTTWTYWRRVAGPILFPSFVGATLLLFTNAFSAYATAAALVSQSSPLLPLLIGGSLRSEVILGQENVGKAMALAMIVVVAVVMTAYAWLDKRSSRWMPR